MWHRLANAAFRVSHFWFVTAVFPSISLSHSLPMPGFLQYPLFFYFFLFLHLILAVVCIPRRLTRVHSYTSHVGSFSVAPFHGFPDCAVVGLGRGWQVWDVRIPPDQIPRMVLLPSAALGLSCRVTECGVGAWIPFYFSCLCLWKPLAHQNGLSNESVRKVSRKSPLFVHLHP